MGVPRTKDVCCYKLRATPFCHLSMFYCEWGLTGWECNGCSTPDVDSTTILSYLGDGEEGRIAAALVD